MSAFLRLGRGTACVADAFVGRQQRAKGVRYSDPLSWAALDAAASAIAEVPLDRDRTGLITAGTALPRSTLERVAKDCARGFGSPTLFPAANPSSPAGLICLSLSLRGPSVHLVCSGERGAGLIVTLSSAWLGRGIVDTVVIVAFLGQDVVATAVCLDSSGETLRVPAWSDVMELADLPK